MNRIAGATGVGIVATCVFWRTAFPSINWWDSSSYSLAAATFGISSSPGSLLLMLLGWPIAHLPIGTSPAYRLNLFAGVLAASTTAGVYLTALRATRVSAETDPAIQAVDERDFRIGAAAGALAFAFASSMWEYAVQFTPYILTVVFTVALLYTLFRWWEVAELADAWKWLALLGLLFGLDLSVHRTNALLVPGAFVLIVIRSPRTIINPRAILASVGALLTGLSVHLLLIPIARITSSELNFGNPRDFSRFREYVSLPNSGGGFLVKVFPRNASVWDVQVRDFLSALRENAFNWDGPAGPVGTLPAVAALIGAIALWRRNRRFAIALLSLLILQSVMTVLFFNVPENYFRSLHRHYLPVWTTIGVFIAYGLGSVAKWIAALGSRRAGVTWSMVALLFIVPLVQLAGNWRTHDASNRYFAYDYASNALKTLPPNAILFTVGDNDTFPLMYLQQAEHVRTDVRIANMSVMNYGDYPDQRRKNDPTFPVTIMSAERKALADKPWTDTLLTLPFPGDAKSFGLPADSATLASATFRVKPMWTEKMLIGDISFLDIIRTNQWRRPITFAITATPAGMSWLEPYGRLEGLHWRIVPFRKPQANAEALRANLLSEFSYRGYADTSVIVDDVSARIAVLYHQSLGALLERELARGDTVACQRARSALMSAIPVNRLKLPPESQLEALPACGR